MKANLRIFLSFLVGVGFSLLTGLVVVNVVMHSVSPESLSYDPAWHTWFIWGLLISPFALSPVWFIVTYRFFGKEVTSEVNSSHRGPAILANQSHSANANAWGVGRSPMYVQSDRSTGPTTKNVQKQASHPAARARSAPRKALEEQQIDELTELVTDENDPVRTEILDAKLERLLSEIERAA